MWMTQRKLGKWQYLTIHKNVITRWPGENTGAVRQSPCLFIQTSDIYQNGSSWVATVDIFTVLVLIFLKTFIKIL